MRRPGDRRSIDCPRGRTTATIAVVYDMLLHLAPSPVTGLHRAIALRYVVVSAKALPEIDWFEPCDPRQSPSTDSYGRYGHKRPLSCGHRR